jgi:hypothetical protein
MIGRRWWLRIARIAVYLVFLRFFSRFCFRKFLICLSGAFVVVVNSRNTGLPALRTANKND